jgi:hypothetical protein
MRKAPYLLAVIGIGFLSLANSSSAGPLASGLGNPEATLPALTEDGVEKVQLWSCRERYRDMTPAQRRFCFGYGYGPRYGNAYPLYGYGYPRYRYAYPLYGYGYPRYRYAYPPYGYGYGYRRYGYGYPGYGLAVPLLGFGLGYWAGRHWDD